MAFSSKPNFRARPLDKEKPLPIYRSEEHPDILLESASVARTVPCMPTGMEKEEEEEHHIAVAITTLNFVIPIPDASAEVSYYNDYTKANFQLPKQYIRTQLWGAAMELPEYDMDDADFQWLSQLNLQRITQGLKPIEEVVFETLMDCFDKAFVKEGQHMPPKDVMNFEGTPDMIEVVHTYFQAKLELCGGFSAGVVRKPDMGDSASQRDPYVAFRRRTERMQTRKNRKNDESSYVNMLKLGRDLDRCRKILDMLKLREKRKRDLLTIDLNTYEQRYQLQDWDGALMAKLSPNLPPPLETLKIKLDLSALAKNTKAQVS